MSTILDCGVFFVEGNYVLKLIEGIVMDASSCFVHLSQVLRFGLHNVLGFG